MKKVGVVIPILNQFELAIKAIESIQIPEGMDWELFIIDNWSTNNGVSGAWNMGARKAIEKNCDYILIINDDIVLSPTTIEHMCSLIDLDYIGVITATDYRDSMTPEQVKICEKPDHPVDIMPAPDFACFMITPETYDYIGEFDNNIYPAYFEDNDYCYRTILAGLRCARSQNAVFYHYGSRTQNSGEPVVPSEQFEANRDYYTRKWGGVPGEEVHSRPWNDYNLSWLDNNPTI